MHMDKKEKNTRGELTNAEVEQDVSRSGRPQTGGYQGTQDTGDQGFRDGDGTVRRDEPPGEPPAEERE